MVLKKLFFIQATRIFLFFLLLNIMVWRYLQLEFVESNQWLPGAGFLVLLSILVFTASLDLKFDKTFKSDEVVIYLQCHNKIYWKILFIVNLSASTIFYAWNTRFEQQPLAWYFLSLPGASWLLVGLFFVKAESSDKIHRIDS